jgi:hypothetical protein
MKKIPKAYLQKVLADSRKPRNSTSNEINEDNATNNNSNHGIGLAV